MLFLLSRAAFVGICLSIQGATEIHHVSQQVRILISSDRIVYFIEGVFRDPVVVCHEPFSNASVKNST